MRIPQIPLNTFIIFALQRIFLMAETDKYLTLDELSEGLYKDKGSRFYSFVFPVSSVDDAKKRLDEYRKKYHVARHVCYAYALGPDAAETRANDDGEPSSTAGKPILGQIVSHGLTDVLVVVVRYYGGVNLGTGGLIVAYRMAAAEALDKAGTVVRQVEEQVSVRFVYEQMNNVMRVVKDMQPRIVDQQFDNSCVMTLSIRKSEAEQLRKRLDDALR